jgi:transcriptional regulator with XRE-family HTH domain
LLADRAQTERNRARVVGRVRHSESWDDDCRCPIEPMETPYLLALGSRLRELRRDRGLTQAQLANAADLSRRHVERLEAGNRRTRESTLARIAAALGDPSLENELVALAGPALAAESAFAERVARRRARRARKRERESGRERAAELREMLERLDALARWARPNG